MAEDTPTRPWMPALVATAVVAAVGAALCATGLWSAPVNADPDGAGPEAGSVAIEEALDDVRTHWIPRARARAVRRAVPVARQFPDALEAVLTESDHPCIIAAIDVATATEDPRFVATLTNLVRSEAKVRDATVAAIARLEPPPHAEHRQLLKGDDPGVRLAAAKAAKGRAAGRIPELVALLDDASPLVRRAAADALPSGLSDEALNDLIQAATTGTEAARSAALGALARVTPLPPSVDALLTRALRDQKPATRKTLLRSLATNGSRLSDATTIWEIVTTTSADLEEQILALYCLERWAAAPSKALEEWCMFLPAPMVRVWAARALITAGSEAGAEILIDLVERAEHELRDPSRDLARDEARHIARRTLADVFGTHVDAPTQDWRTRMDTSWGSGRARLRPIIPPSLD